MSRMPRPVLRYHGGKYRIASWIVRHFPAHRIYVEPFAGAASVLLQKPRSPGEVINDLDSDVVNVFRVLRSPVQAEILRGQCRLTPFSREEFEKAYERSADPIEQARRTIVKSFFGHGTSSQRKNRTGFRARAYRRNQSGSNDWRTWPEAVAAFVERLRGVVIENRDAFRVIEQQDGADTLFYVDPPYPFYTRPTIRGEGDVGRAYAHELTDEDHVRLSELLREVVGAVVLSARPCDLYDTLYAGWHFTERSVLCDSGQRSVERLWFNARAYQGQGNLWPH